MKILFIAIIVLTISATRKVCALVGCESLKQTTASPAKYALFLVFLLASSAVYGQDKPESKLSFQFEGNRIFSGSQLSQVVEKCLATDPKWPTTQSSETLEGGFYSNIVGGN